MVRKESHLGVQSKEELISKVFSLKRGLTGNELKKTLERILEELKAI